MACGLAGRECPREDQGRINKVVEGRSEDMLKVLSEVKEEELATVEVGE